MRWRARYHSRSAINSVVVDLGTDVDQEALRSRALTSGLPAAKPLILGQKLWSRFASVRLFSAAAEPPDRHAGLVWRVDLAQPDHPAALGQLERALVIDTAPFRR